MVKRKQKQLKALEKYQAREEKIRQKADIIGTRNKHVLELIKTKPVKDIVKIYPELTSKKISKIIDADMYEFRQKKLNNG